MDKISVALRILIVVLLLLQTTPSLHAGNQDSPSAVRDLLRQVNANISTDNQIADSLAQEALRIATSLENDSLMEQTYYWLGMVHYYKGDYYRQASGQILMTKYYIHTGDFDLAEQHLNRSAALIMLLGDDDELRSSYTAQMKLYAKMDQQERLHKSLTLLDSITESLIAKRPDANIEQFLAIYELDKNIDALNTELNFKKRAVRNRSLFALLAFVFSMVTLTMYLNLRKKKFALLRRNLELVAERKLFNNLLVSVSEGDAQTHENNISDVLTEHGKFFSLFQRIRIHIVINKSYLNPDLSISDLAYSLHTNEKYISRAIAEGSGQNFSTFINTFRVTEAKKLLSDPANNLLTADQIADKCGFSNASTCRRNFKKFTGLNPLSFQSKAQSEAD